MLLKNDVKNDDDKPKPEDPSNTGMIILFIVIGLIILIAIGFIIRKKNNNKTSDKYS
jgi:LPXTG-motif cell wall-anchored protein